MKRRLCKIDNSVLRPYALRYYKCTIYSILSSLVVVHLFSSSKHYFLNYKLTHWNNPNGPGETTFLCLFSYPYIICTYVYYYTTSI
jgi:hypothetical protein